LIRWGTEVAGLIPLRIESEDLVTLSL